MTLVARVHRYLLAIPCTSPEHLALRELLKGWTLGPLPRESARRWAEAASAPHLVDVARRYLRGAKPWPTRRKSRSPLIVAVEAWEVNCQLVAAKAKE